MPFICYKIGNYDPSLPQDLPNYPHCGYISIDGGPFKKLYYGAVFEVTAGEHSVVCSNNPDLDPKACAKSVFIKSKCEKDIRGDVVTFSQSNIYTISAELLGEQRRYTKYGVPCFLGPSWRFSYLTMQEACSSEMLSKFYNTTITDGYAYLSQRAVHMSGPVSRKTAMEEAEKDYTDETPTYTPSERTKFNTSGGNDAFMTVAGIILIIAVVGLIIWWAWPLLSYIIEDIFKPLFSEIAENLSNLEWKI